MSKIIPKLIRSFEKFLIEAHLPAGRQGNPVFPALTGFRFWRNKLEDVRHKEWRDLAKKSKIFWRKCARLSRRVLGNYPKRISQHFTSREQPKKPWDLARGSSLNQLAQSILEYSLLLVVIAVLSLAILLPKIGNAQNNIFVSVVDKINERINSPQ